MQADDINKHDGSGSPNDVRDKHQSFFQAENRSPPPTPYPQAQLFRLSGVAMEILSYGSL